jgi:glycosyltransferase involved in cell wall biosynthesis
VLAPKRTNAPIAGHASSPFRSPVREIDERRTLCMVVHAYYPLAEPRVQREARAARDAGFEVTVLSLRGDGESTREELDGICVRRIRLKHRRGVPLAWMMVEYLAFSVATFAWLAVRSARRPFDVIHFHNPPDFLVVAGFIPRLRGSRLVLDVHDMSTHMLSMRVSGVVGSMLAGVLLLVERFACAAVDGVVTVHQAYRQELIKHGVPGRKVRVIMNGVDDAVLSRAAGTKPLYERSGSFRVAYHGTLASWYGADLIIDAIGLLRSEGLGVECIILGNGDQLGPLRNQVARKRLGDHVRLSGRYVPIETALATVATADCGVIPNKASQINQFALSSKLFEYVALGIPVVVSRLPTLAAHFDADEVTFFDSGDSASLAKALRWVYDHPGEAQTKATQARSRARDYAWSWGRAELQRFYTELLQTHRSRPLGSFR